MSNQKGKIDETGVAKKYTLSASALGDIKTTNAKNLSFPVGQYPLGKAKTPGLEKDEAELEAGSTENFVTGKYAVHTDQLE